MPKSYKYRVLTGRHVGPGEVVYGPGCSNGAVFQSSQDLLHHNVGLPTPRFELIQEIVDEPAVAPVEVATPVVEEPAPAAPVVTSPESDDKGDGLDTMTVPQLKDFARTSGIDVLGLNRKDELIAAIRRAVDN